MISHSIKVTWHTKPLIGSRDLVCIEERISGTKGYVAYGPVHRDIVEAFISERKRYHMRLRDDAISQRLPIFGELRAIERRVHPGGYQ